MIRDAYGVQRFHLYPRLRNLLVCLIELAVVKNTQVYLRLRLHTTCYVPQ